MRYLIFAASSIGDTVFELALAKGLKQHDENAYVALLVTGANASSAAPRAVCACSDYVDEVLELGSHSVPNLMIAVLKLRAKRFGYSFFCTSNFKATDKPVLFSRAIGCKSISKDFGAGFAKARYSVAISDEEHIVRQYESLAKALYPDIVLDAAVLSREKAFGNAGGAPRLAEVTICIGTNVTVYKTKTERIEKNIKKWSFENWAKLANCLSQRGYSVRVIGTNADLEECDTSTLCSDVEDLIGKTTLAESIAAVAASRLVIGADTGLMHCAAAFGVPTITLFGGTSEAVWRPYSEKGTVICGVCDCRPCYGDDRAITCTHRKCMDSITVDAVINSVQMMEIR